MASTVLVDQIGTPDGETLIAVADLVTNPDVLSQKYTAPYTGAVEMTIQEKLEQSVAVEDFGAVGDGVTDDTAAFQACLDAGFHCRVKDGFTTYLVGTLNFHDGTGIIGVGRAPFEPRLSDGVSPWHQATVIKRKAGTTWVHNRGVTLANFACIQAAVPTVIQTNAQAAAAVAAFADTFLTAGSNPDIWCENLLVLGFQYVYYNVPTLPIVGRRNFRDIHGDCTNGFYSTYGLDLDRYENCHMWPFLTAHISETTTTANNQRSGTAYAFANISDWVHLTNCFSYGYYNHITLDGVYNARIMGGGGDAVQNCGLTLSNNSRFCAMSNHFINSNSFCVNQASTLTGTNPDLKTTNCVFNGVTYGVYVTSGTYISLGDTFMGGTGVAITDNANMVSMVQPLFDGVVTPVTGTSAGLRKLSLLAPVYSRTQPNTTIPNRIYSSALEIIDNAAVAAGVGGALALGSRVTAGYQTLFQIESRLTNATTGSIAADTYFSTFTGSAWADRWAIGSDGTLKPVGDSAYNIGTSTARMNTVYAANGVVTTSDERLKKNYVEIPDAILDAFASLPYVQYQSNEANQDDKLHYGILAQTAVTVFKDAGIDPDTLKFIVYDAEADRYGILYSELLVLEAALRRRQETRLTARVTELETTVAAQATALADLTTRLAALEAAATPAAAETTAAATDTTTE
jgi:hypothetical protein